MFHLENPQLLIYYIYMVGGFNPSDKYKSQSGLLFPTEWKHKNTVPNHQPYIYIYNYIIIIYNYILYIYNIYIYIVREKEGW